MFRTALLITLLLAGCATQVDSRYNQKGQADRVNAWNDLARGYIQAGRFEQAKRPLQRALEIDPKASESMALLALVFQNQQELEIADDYYQQALTVDPKNSTINNNYGIFLLLQQRYERACPHLEHAAANPLYAQRTQALENLAACFRAAGKNQRAEETYRQVLRLNPDAALSLVELSELALDRGDTAESWNLFNRFGNLVKNRRTEHSAKSLWLGVRLARLSEDASLAATYALLLKASYPDSAEYRQYKETRE